MILTVGAYLPTPLYPWYQESFAFNDLTMVIVYATFAVVSAPGLLLFGPASDVLGRRRVLQIALVLGALSSLCLLLAGNTWVLLLGRALQGLAVGSATGAATAMIVDQASDRQRVWASLLATVAFVGGTALGPLLSGMLAEYAPMPSMLPYAVHLVLLGLLWPCVSKLPSAAPVSLRYWRPTRIRLPRAIRRPFFLSSAVGFLAWTVVGIFLSSVPAALARTTGIENMAVSGALLAAMLTMSLLVQPVVLLVDPRKLQLIGLGILLFAVILLGLAGIGSLALTLVAALLAGAGQGIAYSAASSRVDGLTTAEYRGGVNAGAYIAFYLGSGLPAVAVGAMTFWLTLDAAISVIALGTAAAIIVVGTAVLWDALHFRVGRVGFSSSTGRGHVIDDYHHVAQGDRHRPGGYI